MEVEVRLFATFRKKRWKNKNIIFQNNPTIKEILKKLDIREEELGIVLINGHHCDDLEEALSHRDVLSLFPPVGGG